MSNETTDKCPHCGAEKQPGPNRPGGAFHDGWRCGTRRFLPENIRTDLCREREAHNKAREEKANLQQTLSNFVLVAPDELERLEKADAENQILRGLLKEAIEEYRKCKDSQPSIWLKLLDSFQP